MFLHHIFFTDRMHLTQFMIGYLAKPQMRRPLAAHPISGIVTFEPGGQTPVQAA
jgi:hypothetical protein